MIIKVHERPGNSTTFETAKRLFRRHGGVLRASEAIRLGIHPRTLYEMRDARSVRRVRS